MMPIDIIFICYCIYLPVLTAIYVLQMWIIIRPNSQFKESFYALYVASAICDITFIVTSFPEFRWAIYPISNGGGMVADGFAHTRLYLSFACPITQDLLNCFIALNRLTALSMPFDFKRIWAVILPVCLVFSFVFSFTFVIPYAFRRVSYTLVPMVGFVIFLPSTGKSGIFDWYLPNLFCALLEILINFFTLALYCRSFMLMDAMKRANQEISKQNRKLLIIGFTVFVVNIPGLTLQSLMGFGGFDRLILHYNLAWVTDVKCFSLPVIMCIVNGSIRREMIKRLLFWKKPNMISSLEGTSVEPVIPINGHFGQYLDEAN